MECKEMMANDVITDNKETQSDSDKQNVSSVNANCHIPNGGYQDKVITSTTHTVAPEKSKKSSRRIGRFRFARSMSSPAMILRRGKERVPAASKTMEDTEEERALEKENGEWLHGRNRHVSFDECVQVLTKCSVVKMPLKKSTRMIANSFEGSGDRCGWAERPSCFKKASDFSGIKQIAFGWEEMLKTAVLANDLSEVESLCQQWEVNFNKKLSNGLTLLHISSIEGCFRVLQYILMQGGYADAMDDEGWTPLHYAALHGNVPCALALLRAGANIDSRTQDYHRAIELASDDEMILLLGMIMNGGLALEKGNENKETYV